MTERQQAFPIVPDKICGTCHQFDYVGCWAEGGSPWGKCYKNRDPRNNFDRVGVYDINMTGCWKHSPVMEAKTLLSEMKRKGVDMPELTRLLEMVT